MCGRAKRCFTLIELLTVIAIMTLLMSMLTPSLSRARAQAKATACAARLHDMGTAIWAYTNDSDGELPAAEFRPDGFTKWGWAELLGEQLYRHKPPLEPDVSFPVMRNAHGVGSGYFHYFNCPWLGKEEDHTGHYRVYLPAWSYRSVVRDSLGRIDPNSAGDPNKPSTLESVPPHLPLLGDARTGVTGDPTSYIAGGEAAPGPEGRATFDDRHYGRLNLLYPDGHVELAPYQENNLSNFFNRLSRDWDLNGVEEKPDPNAP
jgi:prepilin-type processing-associated H-X9-DG protein